jgi:chromosome segregation ATPase
MDEVMAAAKTDERLIALEHDIEHLRESHKVDQEHLEEITTGFISGQHKIIAQLEALTKPQTGLCWNHEERIGGLEHEMEDTKSGVKALCGRVENVETFAYEFPQKLRRLATSVALKTVAGAGVAVGLLIGFAGLLLNFFRG